MMTRKDYVELADRLGPDLSPQAHVSVADALEAFNPKFNREKFLKRAIKAWEEKHLAPINDEIPY